MSRCRDCGTEIAFVRLGSGRLCPVESDEPEEYRVWTERTFDDRAPAWEPLRLVVNGDVLTVWRGFRADLAAPRGRKYLDGPCHMTGVEVHVCPRKEA